MLPSSTRTTSVSTGRRHENHEADAREAPPADRTPGGTATLVATTLIIAFVSAGCKAGTSITSITDTAPVYSGAVADRSYRVQQEIPPLTLPPASGGQGALTYSVHPTSPVPGLTFDTGTRTITGTPTTVGAFPVDYRVEDSDPNTEDTDADVLTFTIVITTSDDTPPRFTGTVADQTYMVDTEIPPLTLPSASGGDGALTYTVHPTPPVPGLTFDAGKRTLTGTPTTAGRFHVEYQVWDSDLNTDYTDTDRLAFMIVVVESAADIPHIPRFTELVSDQTYTRWSLISPLTLPAATGGVGELVYSLSGAPHYRLGDADAARGDRRRGHVDIGPVGGGLTFDPETRTLSGAPAFAGTHRKLYKVIDANGNTDEQLFDIVVFDRLCRWPGFRDMDQKLGEEGWYELRWDPPECPDEAYPSIGYRVEGSSARHTDLNAKDHGIPPESWSVLVTQTTDTRYRAAFAFNSGDRHVYSLRIIPINEHGLGFFLLATFIVDRWIEPGRFGPVTRYAIQASIKGQDFPTL